MVLGLKKPQARGVGFRPALMVNKGPAIASKRKARTLGICENSNTQTMDEVKPFHAIHRGLWGEIERAVENEIHLGLFVRLCGRIGEEILKSGLGFHGLDEQSIEAKLMQLTPLIRGFDMKCRGESGGEINFDGL